jgi:hypothetical protein
MRTDRVEFLLSIWPFLLGFIDTLLAYCEDLESSRACILTTFQLGRTFLLAHRVPRCQVF